MMDTTAATTDDNFFIEEPQKLRSNFFNKDKSIQLVELLAQQQQKHQKNQLKYNQEHYSNNIAETDKMMMELSKIQTCRLTYIKRLHQFQSSQEHLNQPNTTTTMPRSFIDRLECLCKTTYETDDLSVARQAVDALTSASKGGCCFLEKYIVMLMNFCITKHPLSPDPIKIKIDELLNRVLIVDFDRQQLIENLRRPEYKLTSVEHLVQLLRRVQDMLDYREPVAVSWLTVLLDAYFVELATSEEVVDMIDQISAHTDFQCALLKQTQSTYCLLNTIVNQLDQNNTRESEQTNSPNFCPSRNSNRPYYTVELLEF